MPFLSRAQAFFIVSANSFYHDKKTTQAGYGGEVADLKR